jgi:ComF family protein
MKYRDRPWIARLLAEAMADRLLAVADVETGEILRPDWIVSVPMYPKKAQKRGYNQSDLLGRMLAGHMDLPYRGDLIQRRRQTEVMSGLSKDDRRVNLAGAFAVTAGAESLLQGTAVLLVDDVYTTGSTADACADALLAAGAARVDVLVFAAGANKLVT